MTTYTEITRQIIACFNDEKLDEGMSLATEALTQFPDETASLNYWRLCLAASMEKPEMANQILEKSLSEGTWYSEMLLRQSPSLQAMQEDAEFERLVNVSLKMQEADPTDAHPMLVLRPEDGCGPDDEGCPVIYFLHGNQDSAHNNLVHWSPLANTGWLMALPQSSRALWAGAYAWADYESATVEATANFDRLTTNYGVNEQRVILGGFSMGAEVALAMALKGDIQAGGFLLLAPGGPFMDDLSLWDPFFETFEQDENRQLRGYILTGDIDDAISQANVRTLVKRLNNAGIPTQHDTFANIAHEYPANFPETLELALAYILT